MAADRQSPSRDDQVAAASNTSESPAGDKDDEEEDDEDVDGDELLRRVLIAGGLRSSSAAGGLRRTEVELMEDQEYVASTAGAAQSEVNSVVSNLRDKVCCFIVSYLTV